MIRSIGWPIIIIASAIGAGLAVVCDVGPPIRPLIGFWFLLICPGMAFVRLLHLKERWTELTLAIAVSMAINVIVSEAIVFAKIRLTGWGLWVLICMSVSGAILQMLQTFGRLLDVGRQN